MISFNLTDSRLKKSGLLPVLIVCLALSGGLQQAQALSGYYTEEEVRTFAPEGGPDNVVIRKTWYAEDRMRKDEKWNGITIARFDQSKIYVLDSGSKTYFEVSPEMIEKFAPRGFKMFGAQEDDRGVLYFPDDLYVRTETTRKIGNWNCYQVVTNPKYRSPYGPYVVLWYSTEVDFPVQLFGDQLKQFFGNTPEAEGLFDRLTQFEGYPVRTEAHGSSQNVMTTLIRIERRKDIDPKLFEVPADCKQEYMPEDVPGMRWGP